MPPGTGKNNNNNNSLRATYLIPKLLEVNLNSWENEISFVMRTQESLSQQHEMAVIFVLSGPLCQNILWFYPCAKRGPSLPQP